MKIMELLGSVRRLVEDEVSQNKDQILSYLKQLSGLLKEQFHRTALSEPPREFYTEFEKIVSKLLSVNFDELTLESFRCLRNSVAHSVENQDLLRESSNLIEVALEILRSEQDEEKEDHSVLNEVVLQFLTNATVGNIRNAKIIASGAEGFIVPFLQKKSRGIAYLINTVLNIAPEVATDIITAERFQILLEDLDSDGNLLCLETLASNKKFLEAVYKHLLQSQQLSYLDYLTNSPCKKDVHFFVQEFQAKSDAVLKSDLSKIETEFMETLLLTGLVSTFCGAEEIELLQKDEAFILTVIHLLIMTKSSTAFEPVHKLAQVTEEDKNHPTFMFKSYLIRLVGNLAFRNPENQTLIGESCLPIILDCTSIDNLNPFITQWSILAIRNLLEGNAANQDIVRQMKPTGGVYAPVLQEFGIRIESETSRELS